MIDIGDLLNRHEESEKFKKSIQYFYANANNSSIKRGIYVYGPSGCGKTRFVSDNLKSINVDVIKYDAGDIRNKAVIDTLTKFNMSNVSVISMFDAVPRNIAIIMDEIDGMNNGDKGGITSLIKLIRPKKTKKQKLEATTINPIICIGNNHVDKKIKELMKVCEVIELKPIKGTVMTNIVKTCIPTLTDIMVSKIVDFISGDLCKFINIHNMCINTTVKVEDRLFEAYFQKKSYNNDPREIVKTMLNNNVHIDEHLYTLNETDRTSVGLLWHENIIDVIGKAKKSESIPFYQETLQNICFADYMDRMTFQKQIWQFNEMSSLIKSYKNNYLYWKNMKKHPKFNPVEVRFTKVLTNYSTEYNNNILFIPHLCEEMEMDRKDLFSYFSHIRATAEMDDNVPENITKLEKKRLYRYLDKYTDLNVVVDTASDSELDD